MARTLASTLVRLAYADPPYPGMAKRRYGTHPDFDGEVDHEALIAQLEAEYDGWALSTSAQALHEILSLCPGPQPGSKGRRYKSFTGVRVLAWCKPNAPSLPNSGIYGWEPVLVKGARPPARDLRDYLVCSPDMFTFRTPPAGRIPGVKPAAFCHWVFAWLGARAPDDLDDLFPGSGAVGRAWESWRAQSSLFAETIT